MKKSDSQIQRDVLDELAWDSRVRVTDVGVEVREGIVILSGTVGSWTAHIAAQEAAHRVFGVLDVVNDTQITLAGSAERSDADIAKAVRAALEWDVRVSHEKIRTTVSNGIVTLEGNVEYWSQHEDAARAIRNLAGVLAVRNRILVSPPVPSIETHTLQTAIEDALERHAQHAAKRIRIVVDNGKVILSGHVPSWKERAAVEGCVRGTRGVWQIDNQLSIGE